MDPMCDECEYESHPINGTSNQTYMFICKLCKVGFYSAGGGCLPCPLSVPGCTNCSMDGQECFSCNQSQNYFLGFLEQNRTQNNFSMNTTTNITANSSI